MLRIFEYDAKDFTTGCVAVLDKAENVAVTHNLQQPHMISFEYPVDEKAVYIAENNIAVAEGQAYRLTNVTKECNKTVIIRAEGERIFFADAKHRHIPNVPDMIGVNPYDVISAVFASLTDFHMLTDEELAPLGMARIGSTGVKIDFFSVDKTNPYDVCMAVIEAYGKGEIYVDNYSFAVVERIGCDNNVRLTLDKNMENLTIQRQTTELVTVLHAYGKDDLTISDANGGIPYIVSPNAAVYGVIEGYKDYSEIEDPKKLRAAAEWDLMDEENENRLDTPQLTISGNMIDLSKLAEYGAFEKVSIGDTVHVIDDAGVEYAKRIINITYYPYSAQRPNLTIGSPSNTNLFYAQWQQAKLLKTLMKNSTNGTSKIIASYFNGQINSSQSTIKSKDNKLLLNNALLSISDGSRIRLRLGILNNRFVFEVYDTSGKKVLYTDANGGLTLEGNVLAGGVNVADKLTDLENQIGGLK